MHHRMRVRCNPFLFRIILRLPLKELSSLPALLQLLFQEALTVFGYITAGKDVGNGYPQRNARIINEALIPLDTATVTSPTTPCILMSATSARYINTPGIIGMTEGMVST